MPNIDEIKTYLREQIVEAMYMSQDELDSDALFSSFGLESTTLVKIVNNINVAFSTNLEAKEILPYQSVNRASEAILEMLEGESAA